ncbi:MAG: molybdenum cofactor guanylyltransferase [Dehalococcoidia bacterium]|nr:molybdenum cofactor guanylyltransferase [Dehalococcoidia bacterium]
MADVTGIVLTGGRSSRMGQEKASLVLGGSTLLDRTVAALNAVADDIVIVRAPGQSLPLVRSTGSLTVVADPVEGVGPLAGIATGLAASSADVVLVVGVDHPFLRPPLLRLLVERVRAGAPWAIPELEGHLQPMCSALSRAALDGIRAQLEAGERSPVTAARAIGAAVVTESEWRPADPEALSFVDVDTPEDFDAARQRLVR